MKESVRLNESSDFTNIEITIEYKFYLFNLNYELIQIMFNPN